MVLLDVTKSENISDYELKGLLAHELSHLEEYSRMSFHRFLAFAIHYLFSDNFKREVERATDVKTIEKGYGKELLAYHKYKLGKANTADLKHLEYYYLGVEEIKMHLVNSKNL